MDSFKTVLYVDLEAYDDRYVIPHFENLFEFC